MGELSIKEGITELGVTTYDGQKAQVSSRRVAEVFEKHHHHVLRDIDNLVKNAEDEQFTATNFVMSEYKDSSGKRNKEYILSSDGLKTLVDKYGTNTLPKKAIEWAKQFYNPDLKIVTIRKELEFKEMLENILNDANIIHQMPVLNFKVDFYIESSSIIVEYDEEHHRFKREEDEIRMKKIRKEITRKIIEGEPLHEGANDEPSPWLKNKDVLDVIRVKKGEEYKGIRRIMLAIHEKGNSPADFMS